MNNRLIITLIAAIAIFAITGCSLLITSGKSSWEGSGTLIAPGYGNHQYTVNDIDFSHFNPGDKIKLTVFIGDGDSNASTDLFPEGAKILETGRPVGSLCNIYDQEADTERSIICTINEPGVHKLCIEGNWFSEKGSTNTFNYVIEKIAQTALQN